MVERVEQSGTQRQQETIALHSKVRPPSLPTDMLFRPRLIESLNQCSKLPVALVLGPAGHGKSCLVSYWASRIKHSCAWFSLDREDRALDRFWFYFATSFSVIDVAFADLSKKALSIGSKKTALHFVDLLISRLAQYQKKIILVLEDYHFLEEDSLVHESMVYLISHLPDNVHLVITSRTFPKIGLQKLRIEGKLGIINEKDLCFSLIEVEDLFFRSRCPLSPDESTHLHEYTHGWPVAVKLISLAYAKDLTVDNRSYHGDLGAMIHDYLFEEVINKLPQSVRSFLETTSCIESFSASLAKCMYEEDEMSVDDIISYLKTNGLFISDSVGSDGQSWYRYHTLFVEAIIQYSQNKSGVLVREIRKKASVWYEDRGLYDDAVHVASLSGDFDLINQLISNHWRYLYDADRLANLLRWFECLPDEYISQQPNLCTIQSVPLAASGNRTLAVKRIRQAEAFVHSKKDEKYGILMAVKAITFCVLTIYEEARESAFKALEYLAEDEMYFRGMILQIIAGVKTRDFPEESIAMHEELIDVPSTQYSETIICSCRACLSNLYSITGDFSKALYWSEKTLEPYDQVTHPLRAILNYAYETRTFVFYKQGLFDEARKESEYAITHEHECWNEYSAARTHAVIAQLNFFEGNDEEAEKQLSESLKINAYGFACGYPSLSALQYWQEKGHINKRFFDDFSGYANQDSVFWMQTALDFVADKESRAELVEEQARQIPEQRILARLHCYLLAAAMWEQQGDFNKAEAALEKAFSLSQDAGGADQVFVENAAFIAKPLGRLARRLESPLLTAAYHKLPASKLLRKKSTASTSSLTSREREVIHLVAAGLTTQDIADRLFVSTATIKKHLANIYLKLGVHGRLQAIAKLKEEGIPSTA